MSEYQFVIVLVRVIAIDNTDEKIKYKPNHYQATPQLLDKSNENSLRMNAIA